MPLPDSLKTRDNARLAAYKKHLGFYNGDQWDSAYQRSKMRRLTTNYTRAFIKKISSYVMKGYTVTIEPASAGDEAARRAAEAEDAWQMIAANNGLARVDMASEIDCAVLGDAGFKITWDEPTQRVAITPVDVANTWVWPHPLDPSAFLRVAYRYQLTAEQLATYWGVSTAKESATVVEDWTDTVLTVWIDNGKDPALTAPNPYGFVPFVIYPNEQVPRQWWGESDVAPLIDTAREFNAEYSRLSNLMEISGFPITVVSGVDSAEGIESFPGAVWTMPEGARAEALDLLKNGAGQTHLAYIEDLRKVMHDLSETPRTAFGDSGRELSGVALEVELEPLLQKATRKRAIRADALSIRAGMAFAISDQFTGSQLLTAGKLAIEWEPLTPRDRTRDIADEVALTTANLSSRRTAMLRLGEVDPDEEAARVEAEPPLATAKVL